MLFDVAQWNCGVSGMLSFGGRSVKQVTRGHDTILIRLQSQLGLGSFLCWRFVQWPKVDNDETLVVGIAAFDLQTKKYNTGVGLLSRDRDVLVLDSLGDGSS